MRLLNRFIARYGSENGIDIANRRVAIALPQNGQGAAVLKFWLYLDDGTPLPNGVFAVTLVLVDNSGNRYQEVVTPAQNRITIAINWNTFPAGVYKAWFEIDSPATHYVRTEPFELHLLP